MSVCGRESLREGTVGRMLFRFHSTGGKRSLWKRGNPRKRIARSRDALAQKTENRKTGKEKDYKRTAAAFVRSFVHVTHRSGRAIVGMLAGLVNTVDDQFPIVLRIPFLHTAIAVMSA